MIEGLCYFFMIFLAIAIVAWLFTVLFEFFGRQSDYANEQARKKYAEERKKREAQERREIDELMALFVG